MKTMTDPWLVQTPDKSNNQTDNTTNTVLNHQSESNQVVSELEFEDNFTPEKLIEKHQPLPDSAAYLQGLENKLKKLRKGSNLIEALAAKRQDCMRTLLDENSILAHTEKNDELNEVISNGDSAVQEIYRHFQPIQPITTGEIVHIVNYDQLQSDEEEASSSDESSQ